MVNIVKLSDAATYIRNVSRMIASATFAVAIPGWVEIPMHVALVGDFGRTDFLTGKYVRYPLSCSIWGSNLIRVTSASLFSLHRVQRTNTHSSTILHLSLFPTAKVHDMSTTARMQFPA
jgi:hypothetical protein